MNIIRHAGNDYFSKVMGDLGKCFNHFKLLPPFEREFVAYTIFTVPMWEKTSKELLFAVGVTIPMGPRPNCFYTRWFFVGEGESATIVYNCKHGRFSNLPRELRHEILKNIVPNYKKVTEID